MRRFDTVVIGAGLTGLSFAYHYDRDVPLFEAQDEVGGMVRTIDVDGFKFDLAPHLLHLRNEYVRELVFEVLKLEVTTYKRRACIYYDSRIIPYPFELNLHALSDQIRRDCLSSLPDKNLLAHINEERLRSGSYRDYVLTAFGEGIANHYLLPYNRKIWDTDPAEMNCEWMRYLPTADVAKIRENAFRPNVDAFGYNAEFYYPTRAGIRELADAFAARLNNVQLGTSAIALNTRNRYIDLSSGDRVGYRRLISTIPLNKIAEISDLRDLRAAAKKLVYTTVYTINIIIDGSVPEGVHWMYFPDPALLFYRISFPKNYWPGATPHGEHIIAVEVGSRDHKLEIEEMSDCVVQQVSDLPILDIKKILFTHCIKIPVAYCIYDRERARLVEYMRKCLRQKNVISAGRYGRWEYSAMQDAILYGKELADG